MFTGIVEASGRIEAVRGHRLVVSTDLPLTTIPPGGSIAVDGVCLTAVSRRGRRFEADLGPETLARTTLGERRAGDRVHLERPLRMGDPLGGHLVAGHVDGVGRVRRAQRKGEALEMDVTAPAEIVPFLATKGSITVDGVSLTVNRVDGAVFSVTLIPHTLAVTQLGNRAVGARVNLEADLLARHVARLLESRLHDVRQLGARPAVTANRRSRRVI